MNYKNADENADKKLREVKKLFDVGYLDLFNDEYVIEKETIAPPERYIIIYKGLPNINVDCWEVSNQNGECSRLHVAYDSKEYRNPKIHDTRLKIEEEKNNVKVLRLYAYTCPPDEFDKLFKNYI